MTNPELEGYFTPEQRSLYESMRDQAQWTHGDEVVDILEAKFDDLVRDPRHSLSTRGFGKRTYSKSALSREDWCDINILAEAKVNKDRSEPQFLTIEYNSAFLDDAERRFGIRGYIKLHMLLEPDGNLFIQGNVIDRSKKELKAILFNSNNLKPDHGVSKNTMPPIEAIGLVKSVIHAYERYSTTIE